MFHFLGIESGRERAKSDEACARLLLRTEEPGCDRQVLAIHRNESDATGTWIILPIWWTWIQDRFLISCIMTSYTG